jgi:transcriptional regulator with XRE-family HTH domain
VIQTLREERGLSRASLAQRAGLEQAVLARIESGTVDPPWTTVVGIAEGLGVSVESIASAVVAPDAGSP